MMAIPQTMRAFVLHAHGDFDALKFHTDWPTPKPKAGQVLLHVKACGLNNTDINTRIGWYAKSVTEATSGDVLRRLGSGLEKSHFIFVLVKNQLVRKGVRS
jgi:NADPH:quinone reductase-like Zn-dependent oxidoreductase